MSQCIQKKRDRGFFLELSIRGRLPAPSHVVDHRRGGAQGSVSGWDWRETKKETQIALSLPRGRLPAPSHVADHRRGGAQGSVSGWDWRETKKKRPRNWFLSLPRGRLPTLPLSQYHRRGEA